MSQPETFEQILHYLYTSDSKPFGKALYAVASEDQCVAVFYGTLQTMTHFGLKAEMELLDVLATWALAHESIQKDERWSFENVSAEFVNLWLQWAEEKRLPELDRVKAVLKWTSGKAPATASALLQEIPFYLIPSDLLLKELARLTVDSATTFRVSDQVMAETIKVAWQQYSEHGQMTTADMQPAKEKKSLKSRLLKKLIPRRS
jgi:hypothetical protein